jgi:hypothetical protein
MGGIVVGISMLDQIFAEVKDMDLQGRKEIGDKLPKRVKIFTYVPARAEERYRNALMQEYQKSQERGV